jgi:ATP-dependent protease ClpP protease subunit
LRAERARLAALLGAATGLPAAHVERELDEGSTFTATEALERGVVDEIATR